MGFVIMNERLWYPQLDVYSCIRRLGGLLLYFRKPPGIERLYIADFFFANPPLLHKCKMSRDTRIAFSSLKITRPNKSFLQYPAASLLFNKMEPIQKEAFRAMSGKGIVSIEALQKGLAELTERGIYLFSADRIGNFTSKELSLIRFLSEHFAQINDDEISALRRSSGIRRPV